MHRAVGFVQQERRREIVHEREREHEREDEAHGARVDADRVAREILFERHDDPAERVDADHPERRGRDRELQREIDQRAADHHERHEDDVREVHANARELRRDPQERERQNQLVGPHLLRNGHRLKERIERAYQEAVEAAFADHRRDFADRVEERVVERVAEHPECVEKRHLTEIPTVHGWERVQRDPQRADRGCVIDEREAEPQEKVRAILEDRQQVDPPVLHVGVEAHAGPNSVRVPVLPARPRA